MPDDLHIPAMAGAASRATTGSRYRPRRSPEPGMRVLTISAVAIGGLLLAGAGGWALLGRKPAPIPVIEADSRPLRVKPEHPGGMQVVGAEEQVMGGTESGEAGRMAPAPEVPAPQALRAQMQQTGTPAPATQPVLAAPTLSGSPLPDTPPRPQPAARTQAAGQPPAAPQQPVAAPAAPRPSPAGSVAVQLAAVDSEPAAQAEWQRLSRRMPDLLGERRVSVQRVERDGKPVFRVRTAGFADTAEATGFCAKVKAKGAACTLASF